MRLPLPFFPGYLFVRMAVVDRLRVLQFRCRPPCRGKDSLQPCLTEKSSE